MLLIKFCLIFTANLSFISEMVRCFVRVFRNIAIGSKIDEDTSPFGRFTEELYQTSTISGFFHEMYYTLLNCCESKQSSTFQGQEFFQEAQNLSLLSSPSPKSAVLPPSYCQRPATLTDVRFRSPLVPVLHGQIIN